MAKASLMINSANVPPIAPNKAASINIVKAAAYKLFFFLQDINPTIFEMIIKNPISIKKKLAIFFNSPLWTINWLKLSISNITLT